MPSRPLRFSDTPQNRSSVSVKVADFPFQSLLNTTQGAAALLQQNPNELIVSSEHVSEDGWGFGLHPDSQTPIAIRFRTNDGMSDTPVYILTPGQIIRPHSAQFSGFDWGTPFGWLGGGLAYGFVIKDPEASLNWVQDKVEVIFHRFTFQFGTSNVLALPLRFPWPNATRFNNAGPAFPQGGDPIISVEPTRTILRLRNPIAAAGSFAWTVKNADDYIPVDGPSAMSVESIYPASVLDPVTPRGILLPDPAQLWGGDDATLSLAGDATLAGAFVDVIRYGKI